MNPYPNYKPSGIEWIGDIPEHWDKTRLAFNGGFFKGKGISKADLTDTGYPVLLYGDIYTKYNTKAAEFIRRIPAELREKAFKLEHGDLLFAASGETKEEIGKCICYIGTEEAYASGDVVVFRQSRMDSEFLAYLFNSYKINEQKAQVSKGEIVVHIYASQLRDIRFPIPPPAEQTTIATYLDRKTAEIDALIADKQRLLQLYEEEKAALINRAVTKGINPDAPMKDSGIEWLGEVPEHWELVKMKYACEFILDGTHGSFRRVQSGFRLLSVRNIVDNEFVFRDDDSKVSQEDFEEIAKRFLVQKGDVQLAIVGATLGKVAIVKDLPEQFVTQRSVATLRSNDRCLSEFLYYFIRSSTYQSFLWLNAGFSAQPGVYLGSLQGSSIPLPAIEDQLKVVEFVKDQELNLSRSIIKTQELIHLLTEYRTALISEVVTGKLRV